MVDVAVVIAVIVAIANFSDVIILRGEPIPQSSPRFLSDVRQQWEVSVLRKGKSLQRYLRSIKSYFNYQITQFRCQYIIYEFYV